MLALVEELNKRFYYKDGGLYNKYNITSHALVNQRAGHVHPNGYRRIGIDHKLYSEHRLVWILHYGDIPPTMVIDHINGIRDDNRIENLRLVTYRGNQFNRRVKGYSFCKRTGLYFSTIKYKGKSYFLGRFKTKEEAIAAYYDAKDIYHVDNSSLVTVKEGNSP